MIDVLRVQPYKGGLWSDCFAPITQSGSGPLSSKRTFYPYPMTRPNKPEKKVEMSGASVEASAERAPLKQNAVQPKAPQVFRRAQLVGKFPHIRHLAAPKAVRRLDSEERGRILAAMLLD